MGNGILCDYEISQAIKQGIITSEVNIDEDQIQPASLDLRLGKIAYRVCASFLPGCSTIREKLDQFGWQEIDITNGAVLERDAVYIIPIQESICLPQDMRAVANPKSSTGRLDVFTRLICDYTTNFDVIEAGYCGNLYLEIIPRTFPIIVRSNSRLAQIRLRKGEINRIGQKDLQDLQRRYEIISPCEKYIENPVSLSVNLSFSANEVIAYRAKKHSRAIDVDKVCYYAIDDFWQAIYLSDVREGLILEPDDFYILASSEYVAIPDNMVGEMVAFDPLLGEFRAHYAGFFDPGFGGKSINKSRAVLEVRSFEVPFILQDKQIIAKLLLEPLSNIPEKIYGGSNSHYQSQDLKLSKHFI